MTSDALNWRVEAACFCALPSLRQVTMDGWVVRASGGPIRRANSASPQHALAAASEAVIEHVEAYYQGEGRPVIFRVPELANGIDDLLAARGYARLAPSRTLFGSLEKLTDDSVNVVIEEEASENWLTARDRLGDSDAQTGRFYRAAIDAITLPSAFASVLVDGRVASLAFGVLESDLLVVESVRTDAALRGRGLARQCLTGLFGWAKRRSATSVALQVLADNEPALALYAGLSLSRDLYGYHYRIKPS